MRLTEGLLLPCLLVVVRAVYWDRLESTSTVTTVRLPKGTRGKFLRLQLAGLGFLSIAEVGDRPRPTRVFATQLVRLLLPLLW